jgi:ribonuclease HII
VGTIDGAAPVKHAREALATMTAILRLGVDENGLGPRLGPLVVTGAPARVAEGASLARALAPGVERGLVGDSKGLVSYHDDALGEAWARVLVSRAGHVARTPNEVLEALLLDARAWLRALCPEAHEAQCWSDEGEVFTAPESLLADVRAFEESLGAHGVELLLPRVVVRCTARLNEALAAGVSRFDADLHAMEAIVAEGMDIGRREGLFVEAVCGKVGGRDRYLGAFRVLPAHEVALFDEGRSASTYRFADRAVVTFVKDSDAADPLVGLASLVGKWARDLLMERIVRHHRRAVPAAPRVSGYHDPRTAQFVELTRPSRRLTGLPDTCFERAKRGVGA